MAIFIQKGDAPLTARQAHKRGMAYVEMELSNAGARKGDRELLQTIGTSELSPRLAGILQALGHADYPAYASQWEVDNLTNTENNEFNWMVEYYQAAVARLAQYRLADGRPEVTEEVPVLDEYGMQAFDPATGLPLTQNVVTQAAIDPLPATIEVPVFDEQTGEPTGATQQVANPEIVKDDQERAEAQALIDATPAAVVSWVSGA